ncbi:transporter substrate-binding domain-containing protein [Mesorhizobium sp. NBSH29]|uniref:transporter substrate-binding domain-containing protein n=1 Tax=Mesorhizobium sp. NBSH29 TaxID=2654249 RepID=UPI001896895F|nr:transporter substrate-binding domain-containing protein [Mesorhizobium sp. NBSH29]QPC87197.1 transporter substrate-binding domain-containing protein [Mesorhizobium sp. NBSH29]
MKKTTLALAGLASLLFLSTANAGETLDRVTKNGAMVVATNASWPPQSSIDDSGKLVGYDIDVSTEVAKRLGVTIKHETPEWAIMTGGHWQGRYDLGVASVTPTKARANVIDFVGVYYYSAYVYVVHKDSDAKTVADLDGKVIGVETATTSEDFINRKLEIDAPGLPPIEYKVTPGEVRTYANSMLPFDDLRLGAGVRIDAVIAPVQTAENAIKNGYPLRIIEGEFAFKEPLVIIADKGDAEWTAKVSGILDEMKADGTLSTLTEKWYGKDYSAK